VDVTSGIRMDHVYDSMLRAVIRKGTRKTYISATILKEEETKFTRVDVSSSGLSCGSGGSEPIPGTLTSCIGFLSTHDGQAFQEEPYRDIQRFYPDFRKCVEKQLPRREHSLYQNWHQGSGKILHPQCLSPQRLLARWIWMEPR